MNESRKLTLNWHAKWVTGIVLVSIITTLVGYTLQTPTSRQTHNYQAAPALVSQP